MYYVMGGMWERLELGYTGPRDMVFLMVKPTKSQLPYVTDNPDDSLFTLCKHHSHLYELSKDLHTAHLKKESFEARDVPCPRAVHLTPTQVAEVKRVIQIHEQDLETAADDAMALK